MKLQPRPEISMIPRVLLVLMAMTIWPGMTARSGARKSTDATRNDAGNVAN